MSDVSFDPIKLHLLSTRDPPVGGVNVWTTHFLQHTLAQQILTSFGVIGPSRASDSTRLLPRVMRIGRGFLTPLVDIWFGGAKRTDVVHLCVSGGLSFWRGLALVVLTRPTKKPFVVHLHSRVATCSPSALRMAKRLAEMRNVAFVTPNVADARVFPFFKSIDNFIPSSIPQNIWAGPTEGALLRLVYVGAMLEDKGLFELADSIAATEAEIHIDCYGPDAKPQDLQRLRRHVARLGIEQRFFYRGAVEHAQLPERLKNYDALVLPSRSESFSLAVAEAMRLGLPVVATPVGLLTEAPADAWIRLEGRDSAVWRLTLLGILKNKEALLRCVSQHAYQFITTRYSARQSMAAWRELYERIITE